MAAKMPMWEREKSLQLGGAKRGKFRAKFSRQVFAPILPGLNYRPWESLPAEIPCNDLVGG